MKKDYSCRFGAFTAMQFTGTPETDDLPWAHERGYVTGNKSRLFYYDAEDKQSVVEIGDYVLADDQNVFEGVIPKELFEKLFEETN